MIFENSQLAFRVVDVLSINNLNVRRDNRNRHFCALSFREETDAILRWRSKELVMQPHSVTFFPADVDYYREATVDRMIVFHLELYNHSSQDIETFVTDRPEEISARFHAAYREWLKNRPDRQYRVTGMLYELFAELYTEYARREGEQSPLVAQAVRYLSRHFTQPTLTVPEVAREIGVSESYLRRLFQQELKISPKGYISRLRLQYAASLLDSGYYSVTEVAKRSGFTDEKYFAVAFKRAMGCSPSHYVYQFTDPPENP